MRWDPGTAVVWRSVKEQVVEVAMPCRLVRDTDQLIALYLCPGTRGRQWKGARGGPRGRQFLSEGWNGEYEDKVWERNRILFLHRPGEAHSVGRYWREATGELRFWYVNLEAPWRRTALGFDTWDHTLDIVVKPDLSAWHWKDEDEFAWAQEAGIYTPAEAAAIRAEGERAIRAIEQRASPYSDAWETWQPDPAWIPLTELPPRWDQVG